MRLDCLNQLRIGTLVKCIPDEFRPQRFFIGVVVRIDEFLGVHVKYTEGFEWTYEDDYDLYWSNLYIIKEAR